MFLHQSGQRLLHVARGAQLRALSLAQLGLQHINLSLQLGQVRLVPRRLALHLGHLPPQPLRQLVAPRLQLGDLLPPLLEGLPRLSGGSAGLRSAVLREGKAGGGGARKGEACAGEGWWAACPVRLGV